MHGINAKIIYITSDKANRHPIAQCSSAMFLHHIISAALKN